MNVLQVDDAKRDRKSIEYTVRLRPNASNLAQLAANYFTLGLTEEALPLAWKSWELNHEPTIGMNLALILKDLSKHDESFRISEASFELNPDDFYIRMGYGEELLRHGFWDRAWPIYSGTRPTQAGAFLDVGLPASIKEWDGGELPKDHLLLVVNEGGTGDRLNYARFLGELTKRDINWKFYPYAELFPLYERIFPKERLIANGAECIPDPTHCVTTFDLPAKLKTTPTRIPPPLKFIPSEEAKEKYKIVRTDNLPVVGITYSAAEKFQGGRTFRSLTEGQAMRMVCMTGDKIHWVNVQHDIKMPFPVTNLNFETWDDTLGLLSSLDALVTVDTGTYWLAEGLEIPVYLLVGGNSDWKWLLKTSRCMWSKNTTIYRNEERGFENCVSKLVMDIRQGKILRPLESYEIGQNL